MVQQANSGQPTKAALDVRAAAALDTESVLRVLASDALGLAADEVRRRRAAVGQNVLRPHRARAWAVLGRQLASPLLVLLFITAAVSAVLGETANAAIITTIMLASVGLGFTNEYRAERAADALHERIRHTVTVVRAGQPQVEDVVDLVPGDIVRLSMGAVVPADARLIEAHALTCDESIVTGESVPVTKSPDPVAEGLGLGDLRSCLFMGTVIQSGTATAVVVATGQGTEFGRIARDITEQAPRTEFQRGLARFSMLLLQVALVLTGVIFGAHLVLQRPLLDSLLFALAIAVGITPQLLPAVVSTSLAAGSRALTKRQVLVKRLVCIEDLGDMDILVSDKTGTLTEGRVSFGEALSADPLASPDHALLTGLLATEREYGTPAGQIVGLNAMDAALWEAARPGPVQPEAFRRLDLIGFDHDRRMTTALVEGPDGARRIVTKGSAEDVLPRCSSVPEGAEELLHREYLAGGRVVAVAEKAAAAMLRLTPDDETGFTLVGFLVFVDRPKPDIRDSLERLAALGIQVKIATGDHALVAARLLGDIGIASTGTLAGTDVDAMSDDELREAAAQASIFARVSPEQKARIVRLLRHSGRSVGFLGDGVNDALALHEADIGISVNTAADVAKDAADALLLEKSLAVLADGVVEGRRIFTNTLKYVLMGTSSNFGNMFSASVASLFLPFLPMLPGQILLNNLMYDASQLATPGDRVDEEQLRAPSHWDIPMIRRFMLTFGPVSSLFDFATFGLMLFWFSASQAEFQSGWFIESLATQTLIIFAIRTRRTPFFRSRPSLGLIVTALTVVGLGAYLPYSPLAGWLGFQPLPAPFFLALVAMIVVYLVIVEVVKVWFFAHLQKRVDQAPPKPRTRQYGHQVHRRSGRFVIASPRVRARVRARAGAAITVETAAPKQGEPVRDAD